MVLSMQNLSTFSCWPSRAQALCHSTKPLMPVRRLVWLILKKWQESITHPFYTSNRIKTTLLTTTSQCRIGCIKIGEHMPNHFNYHTNMTFWVRLCYVLFHKILLLNYSLYLCLHHYSSILKNAIRRTTKSQMSGATNSSVQKKVLVPSILSIQPTKVQPESL